MSWWLEEIPFAMQGCGFKPWSRKIPQCPKATQPTPHSRGTCALESSSCNSRPRAPDKPPQCNGSRPARGLQAEKSLLVASKTDIRKAIAVRLALICCISKKRKACWFSKEGGPGDQLQLLKLVSLQLQKINKDTGENLFSRCICRPPEML